MKSQAQLISEIENENLDQEVVDSVASVFKAAFDRFTRPTLYPAGAEVLHQGARAQSVFLMSRGIVKQIRVGRNGQELIVNLAFPGRLLGAASVILQKPVPVTATTVTTCHLYRVSAENFLRLIESDSGIATQVRLTLSQESHENIVRASQLACLSARDRLEQLLSQFISALRLRGQPREVRLRLPLKQLEIAGVIAVTPEHLCVILKRMQAEGMIRREKGWIIVTDPDRLSSPADL